MTKEYIEREALTENIKKLFCADCKSYGGVMCGCCMIDDALMHIDDAPAADVVPVVHGEWINCNGGNATCSHCKTQQKNVYDDDNEQHFCGHCGAKMDGGTQDVETV